MYLPVSESAIVHDFIGRARGDQFAAVATGARTEVDDVVGAADRFFVVLDHEHGVAKIAQRFERLQQALIVAMMQADGRLVEDVEHAAQLEPICVARRMRWPSPPESVAALRSSDM